MKLTIELELEDNFDYYYPNNDEKLKVLLNPELSDVKATVVENLDLQNVSNNEVAVCATENCNMPVFVKNHCRYHLMQLDEQQTDC